MNRFTWEHYKKFIEPTSVAIIGVSEKTGPDSYNLMENMLEDGCECSIYPVNIRADMILGHTAYSSVLDIKERVDLAIISLPRTVVVPTVKECLQKGIQAIIIISQGFADSDREGVRLQNEIEDLIGGTDTRIIGPNTIGVVNTFAKFHSSFQKFDLVQRNSALICQSGLFLLASADFTAGVGIGVDIGNGMDVHFKELLPCFLQDERIGVINLHIEGITDGRAFLKEAVKVSQEKPILAYKTGKSKVGAKAAASHSGSLAGEDHIYSTALKKAGILRVDTIEELQDLNRALLTYQDMKGKKIGVITITGGGGIAAVDALSQAGLDIANLSKKTEAAIGELNPSWLEVDNPVDIWAASMKGGFRETCQKVVRILLADPKIDAVVLCTNAYQVLGYEFVGGILEGVIKEAEKIEEKPVAIWPFGANQDRVIAEIEKSGIITGFKSPDRLAKALKGVYTYYNEVKTSPRFTLSEPNNIHETSAHEIMKNKQGLLPANEALELLQAYGINSALLELAADERDCLSVAEKLGYPLVMKIASPDILHKSDVGGVKVNIKNQNELITAYNVMVGRIAQEFPEAQVDGVYLQQYHASGIEVIVGSKRDEIFGPVLVFGLGGIYTEVLKDVSFGIAPLSALEARNMINDIKGRNILFGARGGEAVQIDVLVDILLRVSKLVMDFPGICELDINPLRAGSRHTIAVDSRVILEEE